MLTNWNLNKDGKKRKRQKKENRCRLHYQFAAPTPDLST